VTIDDARYTITADLEGAPDEPWVTPLYEGGRRSPSRHSEIKVAASRTEVTVAMGHSDSAEFVLEAIAGGIAPASKERKYEQECLQACEQRVRQWWLTNAQR